MGSKLHQGFVAGASVSRDPGVVAVAQIFPPWWNKLPLVAAIAGIVAPLLAIGGVVAAVAVVLQLLVAP